MRQLFHSHESSTDELDSKSSNKKLNCDKWSRLKSILEIAYLQYKVSWVDENLVHKLKFPLPDIKMEQDIMDVMTANNYKNRPSIIQINKLHNPNEDEEPWKLWSSKGREKINAFALNWVMDYFLQGNNIEK